MSVPEETPLQQPKRCAICGGGGASAPPPVEPSLRWLGTLGGDSSDAYGVSADGSVVVGQARNATGTFRAFRWTASRGMEDLNAAYASLLSGGSSLDAARAISPNGRYIVGFGFNAATGRTEAFLLDTGGGP